MFGRRSKRKSDGEQRVDIDVALEQDISMVEQAVDSYLQSPTDNIRAELLAALEGLDDQTDQGDTYQARLSYPFLGPRSSVVGATSDSSMGEELPSTEFQAQIALVKAAKNAVTRLTPDTLADLRAASDALAAWRTTDQ